MTRPPESKRREAMRELGRAGGIASGQARRRKRRTAREHLERLVGKELADGLLGSSAGAVKAASILGDSGYFRPEPEPEPTRAPAHVANPGAVASSWVDMVELAYRDNMWSALGLPSPERIAELVAQADDAGAQIRRDVASSVPGNGGVAELVSSAS